MLNWLFKKNFSSQIPIIAGMATMPSRYKTFPKALKSILHQVDHLYLFLDSFESVPDVAINDKVTILRSQDHGNIGGNGKFLGLNNIKDTSYFLTVDDDIYYPGNYVKKMINKFSKLESPAVLGLHGSILELDLNSYVDDREILHRLKKVKNDRFVDILGTDAVILRTDQLNFDVKDWGFVNIVDIHFAMECAQRNISRISVKRSSNWVKALDSRQLDSIFVSLMKDDSIQTKLAKKLLEVDPCKHLVTRN